MWFAWLLHTIQNPKYLLKYFDISTNMFEACEISSNGNHPHKSADSIFESVLKKLTSPSRSCSTLFQDGREILRGSSDNTLNYSTSIC